MKQQNFISKQQCLGLFQLLLILMLPGLQRATGQTYKMYHKAASSINPLYFSVKDLAFNPSLEGIVIGGELRYQTTSNQAYGYTFETGLDGYESRNQSIIVNTTNGRDAFNFGGVALDANNKTYICGSYASDLNNPNAMTEKTISGLDVDGKLMWAKMEGSHHFGDITYDRDDNALIAIGSPDGVWTASQPLSIVKIGTDGALMRYKTIYDPVYSNSVKVVDLPSNQGYLICAVFDTMGLKAPYIIHLDQGLRTIWSFVYSDFLQEFDVQDMAYHEDGYIAVVGNSYDPITEDTDAFLMSLDMSGNFRFMRKYQVDRQGQTEHYGVAAFSHSVDSTLKGFLISGAFEPAQGTAMKHAIVFQTDLEGTPEWSHDYSNLPGQDFEEIEEAKRIIFLNGKDMFAVAGEYTRYLQGQQARKFIWSAKASIRKGQLVDDGLCSSPVKINYLSDTLGIYKAGQDSTIGSLTNFSYGFTDVGFHSQACSYDFNDHSDRATNLENLRSQTPDAMEVFDLSGRKITNTTNLDVSQLKDLQRGLYLLRYFKQGTFLYSEKVVLP
ncbi:MAG: T9SS type A sorting domain-containing protein [Bacteroidota bacterium]